MATVNTQQRQLLTPQEVLSVQDSIRNWAWVLPTALNGTGNITTFPRSAGKGRVHGIIRAAAVLDPQTGLFRHCNFLMSVRAGWTTEVDNTGKPVAPASLLNSVNQANFLDEETKHGVTLTFNPNTAGFAPEGAMTQREFLDIVWPDWANAKPGDERPVSQLMPLKVLGISFAAGRAGRGQGGPLAKTGKGGYIYNFVGIQPLQPIAPTVDLATAGQRPINALDEAAFAAEFGPMIGATPNQGSPNAQQQSRNVLNNPQPDANAAAPDLAALLSNPAALQALMAQAAMLQQQAGS